MALRGGESKLHFGESDRGTDRNIGYNTKFGLCICNDAEGRADSDYPGEIESRKADLEEPDVRSLDGALGVGTNVEGSGNVSGKTASEGLLNVWSGSGAISYKGSTYQLLDIWGYNRAGYNEANICG